MSVYENESRLAVEEHRPNISWGAIIAGAFVAFVVHVTLMSLGSAIGFTAFDPENGDSVGQGALITLAVYTAVVTLISLFAGGFISSRMAGYRLRSVAGLHGLMSWAVVSAVTVVMVSTGIGKLVGGTVGLVGQGVKGAAQAGVNAAGAADLNVESIRNEVRQLLQETGKPELNPDQMRERAENVPTKAADAQANQGGTSGGDVVENEASRVAGAVDTEAVANVLSKRLGISKEEATSLIGQGEDQARATIASVQAKAPQAGMRAAEVSTNAAAGASWITFATLLLGAIASYLGGLAGGPSGFGPMNSSDVVIRRRPATI